MIPIFLTYNGKATALYAVAFSLNRKFLFNKKRSAMDAHSRDRNMLPSATALGARMSQATFFFMYNPYDRMKEAGRPGEYRRIWKLCLLLMTKRI